MDSRIERTMVGGVVASVNESESMTRNGSDTRIGDEARFGNQKRRERPESRGDRRGKEALVLLSFAHLPRNDDPHLNYPCMASKPREMCPH